MQHVVVAEELRVYPPPSPAVLQIMKAHERKLRKKKHGKMLKVHKKTDETFALMVIMKDNSSLTNKHT